LLVQFKVCHCIGAIVTDGVHTSCQWLMSLELAGNKPVDWKKCKKGLKAAPPFIG